MVRQIGNVLVFGLAILLLSSCVGAVKEITSYKIEKKRNIKKYNNIFSDSGFVIKILYETRMLDTK